MKRLLLSLSVLLILGAPKISAQLINSDFETWTQNFIAPLGVYDPNTGNGSTGWWEFNVTNASFPFGSSPVIVYQGFVHPFAEHGNYYAAIVSQVMSSTAYSLLRPHGFIAPDTNGYLFTGYQSVAGSNVIHIPGEPWGGGRSPSFSFWYRYIPVPAGDTATCAVGMFHWNTVTQTQELIGHGFWSTSATQTTWTKVTIPITYDSATSIPDTILIGFSACALLSKDIPKPGDTLDIDNSSIVLGVGNLSEHLDNINLYPNPANTEVNLSITGLFTPANLEVYDITGREVGTYPVRNNFLTINTQSYTTGVYIYKLLNDSGNQLNVGKFNVVK